MKSLSKFIFMILISTIIIFCNSSDGRGAEHSTEKVDLRILETTDLHGKIVDYDYNKNKSVVDYGLVRTATLIKEARKESTNSLLFDNGDLLQGSLFAEYIALTDNLIPNRINPIYKAMNLLHYDAATFGNHDFHYGFDYLNRAIANANFPYVNANMYLNDRLKYYLDGINIYKPYVIIDKKITDRKGMKHTLKVGVIGFITPEVIIWEKKSLNGMAKVTDIVQSAETYIPKMKKEGADIIIALAHSGIDYPVKKYTKSQNAVYPLSKVKGIDVILFGHQHKVFPDKSTLKGVPNVDTAVGTINGIPAVEAGSWGNYLGIVDLTLQKNNGKWSVIHSKSRAKPIYKIVRGKKKALVKKDKQMMEAVKKTHEEVIMFSKKYTKN